MRCPCAQRGAASPSFANAIKMFLRRWVQNVNKPYKHVTFSAGDSSPSVPQLAAVDKTFALFDRVGFCIWFHVCTASVKLTLVVQQDVERHDRTITVCSQARLPSCARTPPSISSECQTRKSTSPGCLCTRGGPQTIPAVPTRAPQGGWTG